MIEVSSAPSSSASTWVGRNDYWAISVGPTLPDGHRCGAPRSVDEVVGGPAGQAFKGRPLVVTMGICMTSMYW